MTTLPAVATHCLVKLSYQLIQEAVLFGSAKSESENKA